MQQPIAADDPDSIDDEVHSIRLFPKGEGADAVELTGIARLCDWVVLTDTHPPTVRLRKRRADSPRTIFVSMRSPFRAIRYFYEQVLPRTTRPFVLITGSEDATLPTQTDARWRRFSAAEDGMIDRIQADPRLVAWYAENVDSARSRLLPIPTGVMPTETASPVRLALDSGNRIPGTVLCCHRIRRGPQWETRRRVTRICSDPAATRCRVVEDEIGRSEFQALLRSHQFALCVEGGGLDPSPKAWEALINGCIPIIRRTALAAAYDRLPVCSIESWNDDFLDPAWLAAQALRLRDWFETPEGRDRLRHRLSLGYWWGEIDRTLEGAGGREPDGRRKA